MTTLSRGELVATLLTMCGELPALTRQEREFFKDCAHRIEEDGREIGRRMMACDTLEAMIDAWREKAEKAESELARLRQTVGEYERGYSDALRTLASAIHKFAPELSLELSGRWNVAKGEAEAALQEFLAALTPTPTGETK